MHMVQHAVPELRDDLLVRYLCFKLLFLSTVSLFHFFFYVPLSSELILDDLKSWLFVGVFSRDLILD